MTYLIPPDHLETSRVLIRCYRAEDGPKLAEGSAGSYAHLRPWMPWASPEPSIAASTQSVRQFRARWLLAEDFVMGIWTLDESRLLGGTGFHPRGRDLMLGVADIGMWVRADCAGQGLGTHVLEALIDWGFQGWPWQRLVWTCDARNVASMRTAEKAGMQLEGITLRDSLGVDGHIRDTARYVTLKPAAQ